MTKYCPRCALEKSVEEFAPVGYCRECTRAYGRDLYSRDKEHHKARRNNNRVKRAERAKEYVQVLKALTPCADCNNQYPPYVMHFDHVDPSQKKFNISSLTAGHVSMEVLEAEIKKCELVCANCHAERTYRRGYRGHKRAVPKAVELKNRNRPIQDQHGHVYASQRAAALELGLQQAKISMILHGKRKSHKGYVFTYVSDEPGNLSNEVK